MQDEAIQFVAAWMSLGSIDRVSSRLGMPCDNVLCVAQMLRAFGVNLPESPARDDDAAEEFGFEPPEGFGELAALVRQGQSADAE